MATTYVFKPGVGLVVTLDSGVTYTYPAFVTLDPATGLPVSPAGGGAGGGGLTDAELRASAVPVTGPLTDTQLRATAVPVSGPLTNAQLAAITGAANAAAWDGVNASATLIAIQKAIFAQNETIISLLTDIKTNTTPTP